MKLIVNQFIMAMTNYEFDCESIHNGNDEL